MTVHDFPPGTVIALPVDRADWALVFGPPRDGFLSIIYPVCAAPAPTQPPTV
jgi:hypothetical protein